MDSSAYFSFPFKHTAVAFQFFRFCLFIKYKSTFFKSQDDPVKFSRAKGDLATDCLKSSEKLRKESFNVMQKTLLQPRPDHVQNSRSMLFCSRKKISIKFV